MFLYFIARVSKVVMMFDILVSKASTFWFDDLQ